MSGMLKVERQNKIMNLILSQGSVHTRVLSDLFSVTHETIRRDFKDLEERGLILVSHGGAIQNPNLRNEPSLDNRLHVREAQKIAIGRAAADLVSDGSTIIIDSGSTTLHFARALKGKHDIFVITNAIPIAEELLNYDDITVFVIGGIIQKLTAGCIGETAMHVLSKLKVDQTFLAVNSISVEDGLMYPRFEEASIKQAMIEAASKVILLADFSKFGKKALVRFAPLNSVQCIVTDWNTEQSHLKKIENLGINVIVAPDPNEFKS